MMDGLFLPKNTQIHSKQQLFDIILNDSGTQILSMKDDSRYGIMIVIEITDELQENLGIYSFDDADILGRPLQRVNRFAIKLVHLGKNKNDYQYISLNQKVFKYTQTKYEFNKEIFFQRKIYNIGLKHNKILTPEICHSGIYEYKSGGRQIFSQLKRLKVKRKVYERIYDRMLDYYSFPPMSKNNIFGTSYEGVGMIMMRYMNNYDNITDLSQQNYFDTIKKKQKFTSIIEKQLYVLKQNGIIHSDLHPGNYIWNKEKQYGMILDFGKTQYSKNVKRDDYLMNHFVMDSCDGSRWLSRGLYINEYTYKSIGEYYNTRIDIVDFMGKIEGYISLNELGAGAGS